MAHTAHKAQTTPIEQLARRAYEAYVTDDRAMLEELIAEDFRFTSPYDDAIDRKTYFERCWPNHERTKSFTFKHIVVDGDLAYVTYVLETKDERRIDNTELLRFANGKLVSADVYFGAVRDKTGAFVAMSK
jgi:ketosteroid isomerase-like protein